MSQVIAELGSILLDPEKPLKQRLMSAHALEDIGLKEAIHQLERCFTIRSSLIKEKVSICLGRLKDPASVRTLVQVLDDYNTQGYILISFQAFSS